MSPLLIGSKSKLLPSEVPEWHFRCYGTLIALCDGCRLIKVKGMQVAPAELESHLLTHPAVNDCVVIGIPSEREGEVPKACTYTRLSFLASQATTSKMEIYRLTIPIVVVKAAGAIEDSDTIIKREIAKHVEKHKSNHKWLRGGVEFIDEVPKSPSGKILRRMLRDKEKAKLKKETGAKL